VKEDETRKQDIERECRNSVRSRINKSKHAVETTDCYSCCIYMLRVAYGGVRSSRNLRSVEC
jgi:hypothetical protein